MPRKIIVVSLVLMSSSLLFAILNRSKVAGLRNEIANTTTARDAAAQQRLASDRKLKAQEKALSAATSRQTTAEEKAQNAEAELSKAQNEKAEIESKLKGSEAQVADLQKRVAEATIAGVAGAPEGVSAPELKALLDDSKQQLAAAEEEKAALAEKVKESEDRIAALEKEKKRRTAGANPPGLHGTVLAVNQVYNFVVLSMGDRQGVVPNSEMLVLRHGSLIGRIRISSVEPTTSIGDIITNSLARGVQVQPGDTVIYAGSTNS
jgi:hypothetical protein